MGDTLTREGPASVWWELRAPAELAVFLSFAPLLHAAPKGDPRPVLVLPGFGVNDRSTIPLRALLRRLGHQPSGWDQGRNLGPTSEVIDGLTALLRRMAAESGRRVPIIGWSLGGIYGRALAQWHPELVDQVISLGSPFNIAAEEQTTVSPLYDRLARRRRFVRNQGEIDLDAVPCPSTAIYTRTDGIVSWFSCRQSEHRFAENIEVWGSHCALGVNVAVAYAVADRLTHNHEDWHPFRPPKLLKGLYPNMPCDN